MNINLKYNVDDIIEATTGQQFVVTRILVTIDDFGLVVEYHTNELDGDSGIIFINQNDARIKGEL